MEQASSRLAAQPMGLNPLRDLLTRLADFGRLRERSPFKLFVGATQANTGEATGVSRGRAHGRCAAGIGLPAEDSSSDRDRRRAVLGRRVRPIPPCFRSSAMRFAGRPSRAAQPADRQARPGPSVKSTSASPSCRSTRHSCARCRPSPVTPNSRARRSSRRAGSSASCTRRGFT